MTDRFAAPKGVPEYTPPEGAEFLAVRDGLTAPARLAGYAYITTPLFEDTALFARGVGESTDVVSKEMYTFADKGGRSITLRPEFTAGIVRSVIEHGLDRGTLPVKLWTDGPCFRYERPQAGRYRQLQQVDVEAIGSADPALDAEMITLAADVFAGLGLSDWRLELSSLGDRNCRPAYRKKLTEYLTGLDLDADTRRRAEINPLRVLDDKRPEVRSQLDDAPLMADNLCPDCQAHYDAVRARLADTGVDWVEAPRLVRGLDYYTRTTFEFVHVGLGAQASIGGGGRYDGLMAELGGADTPAIGFALGVDRTLLAARTEGVSVGNPARCDAFLVPLGDAATSRALPLATELRRAGVATDLAFGGRGLKGAMRAADRSGARVAVIFGERDLVGGLAQLKDLASGEQAPVPLTDLVITLKERLT